MIASKPGPTLSCGKPGGSGKVVIALSLEVERHDSDQADVATLK